jgi:flagellar biosynthesis protein FlhF
MDNVFTHPRRLPRQVPQDGGGAPESIRTVLEQIAALNRQLPPLDQPAPSLVAAAFDLCPPPPRTSHAREVPGLVERLLEFGLLPAFARDVAQRLQAAAPGASVEALWQRLPTLLSASWRAPALSWAEPAPAPVRVLVGPAGVGKTTCLCKWLSQSVLLTGRSAMVWRLDGETANAAEVLSIYCEILGVPCVRTWVKEAARPPLEAGFIDVPGVDWQDPPAIEQLARRIGDWDGAQVYLVLNAAYEAAVMLAQARAFAALPIAGLIVTHLDEEPRRGKLWNVVLGTKWPLCFLSAGQNVPGEFHAAEPAQLESEPPRLQAAA